MKKNLWMALLAAVISVSLIVSLAVTVFAEDPTYMRNPNTKGNYAYTENGGVGYSAKHSAEVSKLVDNLAQGNDSWNTTSAEGIDGTDFGVLFTDPTTGKSVPRDIKIFSVTWSNNKTPARSYTTTGSGYYLQKATTASGDWVTIPSTDCDDTAPYYNTDSWVIVFDSAISCYGIRLVGVGTEGYNSGCGDAADHFEVCAIFAFPDVYDTSKLAHAIERLDKAFDIDKGNTYGYSNESWNAFTSARTAAANAAATYGGELIDGSVLTQADLDQYATGLYAAAAKLTGDGNVTENKLQNGIMIYNIDDMQIHVPDHNIRTLTNGSYANNANAWQPHKTDTPVYLKLNNAADINKIVIYAESTSEIYKIEYVTGDVSNVADVAGMEALTWTDTNAERKYSVEYGSSVAYSYYTFDLAEDVTAIKLTCTTPNGSYCKLREVEAYCDETSANFFESRKTYEDKTNNQQFAATIITEENVAAAAAAKKSLVAHYTITRDTTTASGTVTVENAYAMITLGDNTITSGDIPGGHAGDYVTGVLFTNLQEGDEVSVTFAFE